MEYCTTCLGIEIGLMPSQTCLGISHDKLRLKWYLCSSMELYNCLMLNGKEIDWIDSIILYNEKMWYMLYMFTY